MSVDVYLFENTEVVLTGRVARREHGGKVDELVEVRPLDPENGSWKKFTRISVLYKIENTKDE